MIVIPTWITNCVILAGFVLSAYQHWRLNPENPVTNSQFVVMVFSILMLLVVTLFNRTDPWLSLALFLIAAASLFLTIRRHRKLPPSKAWQ
jgi:Ca2+/Na+ antiporter